MLSWLRKKKTDDTPPAPQRSTMEMLAGPIRSRDEFVLLYSKLIEERRPGIKIVLAGETAIEMTAQDGRQATTFLDNLWIQMQQAEDRQELIEKHASAMLAMLDPKPQVQLSQIIPTIKDEIFVRDHGQNTVRDHIVADLYCIYAIDWPDRIESLSEKGLEELKVERTALQALAVENLRAILPATECHGSGPWYWLSAGSDYVASLLLFDSIWEQVAEMIDGDIVAVVPARDTLLFTGSRSQEGIAFIRQQAEEIIKGGHHVISSALLLRRDGLWSAFN